MASSTSQPGEGRGPWKDERRAPGPWPQGRRKPLAILAVVAVGIIWRLVSHALTHWELAAFVLLIGLSSFWVAARMNQKRLAEERYIRGPGWWLGWLISKTSVGFARAFHIVLGLGICGLAIAFLVAKGP